MAGVAPAAEAAVYEASQVGALVQAYSGHFEVAAVWAEELGTKMTLAIDGAGEDTLLERFRHVEPSDDETPLRW